VWKSRVGSRSSFPIRAARRNCWQALRLAGFEPYLDKHDIAAGEARLGRLIERMLHKLTIVRATLRHRLFVTFGEFQPWAYALLTKMFHAS
jgi:hypothetical protein